MNFTITALPSMNPPRGISSNSAIPVRTLPPSPIFPVKNWSNPESTVLELGVVNFLDPFQIPQMLRDSAQDFPISHAVQV